MLTQPQSATHLGLRVGRCRCLGFTLVELLVVSAIIGVLTSLLLPAVHVARSAARRVQCTNNLRQIGIAVNSYEAAHRHLPPPKVGTQFENRGSTWVLLLPYLEENARFQEYDTTKPVDDPNNVRMTGDVIATYLCPQMHLPRVVPDTTCGEMLAPASYVISTRTQYGNHKKLDGAFKNPPTLGRYRLALRHIRDGASNTIVAGEVNYGHRDFIWTDCPDRNGQPKWGDTTWADGYWYFAWGHMSADFPELFNNSERFASPNSVRAFRSDHVGGVNFVMLDASVRFLTNDSDPELRAALVSRSGGELIRHHE
jgi:prepilin-type N-terminal cleavage/methylation domain-containing protein